METNKKHHQPLIGRMAFGMLIMCLLLISGLYAQERFNFKTIDSAELFMDVHYPKTDKASKDYPAMVFFFGGGWNNGSRMQFYNHAKYFAERGLVCFLVDYRIKTKYNSTPFDALKDAKSAIRYVRKNAARFGIDPDKIIASGGSSGGHLALSTAIISGYNEPTDDLSVSCVPNALVLFNPLIDTGPGGYGYGSIGAAYKNFSPIHNIQKGAPPILLLMGTEDKYVPMATALYFETVMKKVNNPFKLIFFEGQGHSFFNYSNFEFYKKSVLEADKFLQSLDYLKSNPKVIVK